jgi:hypothetical protein
VSNTKKAKKPVPGLSEYLASAPKNAGMRNPKTRARLLRLYPALEQLTQTDTDDITVERAADLTEQIYDLCAAVFGDDFGPWIETVPVELQEDAMTELFSRAMGGLGKG